MKTRRVFLTMVSTSAAAAACSNDPVTLGERGEGGAGAGAAGGQGGFGVGAGAGQGGAGGDPEMLVAVADVSDLVEGELFGVPSPAQLFLGLDAEGIYAMTTLCTHNNCDMIIRGAVLTDGGRRCTCHNSRFDAHGNVTMGPAQLPLRRFHVEIDGTTIYVHKGMIVDSSFRAPLPSGAGGAGGAGGSGGSGGDGGS